MKTKKKKNNPPEIAKYPLGSKYTVICEILSVVVFQLLSHVWLFVALWTVAHQAPSVQGNSQARILKWVIISSSRGTFEPRDWTHIFCIGRWILYHWATKEALISSRQLDNERGAAEKCFWGGIAGSYVYSLGYSPQGRKQSDTTERLHLLTYLHI